MKRNRMRKPLTAALFALLSTACSSAFQSAPADIPSLEAALRADPGNADAATQLGIAYYRAARASDAVTVLTPVVAAEPEDETPYLYLGLAAEELENWPVARSSYERYLELSGDDEIRSDLRARLALIAREELKLEARAALEREAELSQQAPAPNSVAVFPFRVVGTDSTLEPLQAALADMIITDLGLSNALVSVERVRVQSLLNEMVLASAGFTDQATGARAGRLLRAENVVQGVLSSAGDGQLRLDAAVLDTEQRVARSDISQQGSLEDIFDLEKALVFGILDRLGVTLTIAEREAINENRSDNLLAFLAYGRGLEELDQGNYGAASALFDQATSLDPSFARARTQQGEAATLQQGQQVQPQRIATAGLGEAAVQPVATGAGESLLQEVANDVVPTPTTVLVGAGQQPDGGTTQGGNRTAPQNEAGGGSGLGNAAKTTIVIVIPRPGA